MDKIQKVMNFLSTDSFKNDSNDLLEQFISMFAPFGNVVEFVKSAINTVSSVRDDILFENFVVYIMCVNDYDECTGKINEDNLSKLADLLIEAEPDEECGIAENPSRLHEYEKRIIKAIDDCGTAQKAEYLASITVAFIHKEINRREFFKISQCINMLTEEDLLFLKSNVNADVYVNDGDFIDEFVGLGLMYQTDRGYAYSLRAFDLLIYALGCTDIVVPEKFPERNISIKWEVTE